jgi:hypothetical protein
MNRGVLPGDLQRNHGARHPQGLPEPREINQSKVDAQQARRVLDRIVGYQVSPLLWRRIRGATSAGRVQSVALRLVCEREREILAFKPEEYWLLGAKVRKFVDPRDISPIQLAKIDGEKADVKHGRAGACGAGRCGGRRCGFPQIIRREINRRAPAVVYHQHAAAGGFQPLGLCAEAHHADRPETVRRRGFRRGPVGLITYMRTDSRWRSRLWPSRRRASSSTGPLARSTCRTPPISTRARPARRRPTRPSGPPTSIARPTRWPPGCSRTS